MWAREGVPRVGRTSHENLLRETFPCSTLCDSSEEVDLSAYLCNMDPCSDAVNEKCSPDLEVATPPAWCCCHVRSTNDCKIKLAVGKGLTRYMSL